MGAPKFKMRPSSNPVAMALWRADDQSKRTPSRAFSFPAVPKFLRFLPNYPRPAQMIKQDFVGIPQGRTLSFGCGVESGRKMPMRLSVGGVALMLLGASVALPQLAAQTQFVDVRERATIDYRNVSGEPEKRYIVSSLGNGVALFDYDQDGDLDIYLVNGAAVQGTRVVASSSNRLYRNEGAWRFTDVSEAAGVAHSGWGLGCAVGDVDNDGLPDLYITQIGKNLLFRNLGDGTFVDISELARVGNEGFGTSAAFFDADGDADLDLYVANYSESDVAELPLPGTRPSCRWFDVDVFCGPSGLSGESDVFYRNESDENHGGALVFTEATQEAGLFDASHAYGLGVVTGDYDGDGDQDVYVANDSVPNFLFTNDGSGGFVETAFLAGVAYSAEGLAQAGMGVDMADADGDGRLDLFVTNFSHDTNTLYRNFADDLFEDTTARWLARTESWFYLGWATRFVDFDNDGDQDLFVANGHVYPDASQANAKLRYAQRNQVFWNLGTGRFELGSFLGDDAMSVAESSRGGGFGDLDDDGDVDAVVVNIDGPASILRNELPRGANAVTLRLVGRSSNRDAVGARVVATIGGDELVREVHASGSYLSSSDLRLHFGLGTKTRIDKLLIRWPNGLVEERSGVDVKEARESLTFVEPR